MGTLRDMPFPAPALCWPQDRRAGRRDDEVEAPGSVYKHGDTACDHTREHICAPTIHVNIHVTIVKLVDHRLAGR